jgi:hypothetical protein
MDIQAISLSFFLPTCLSLLPLLPLLPCLSYECLDRVEWSSSRIRTRIRSLLPNLAKNLISGLVPHNIVESTLRGDRVSWFESLLPRKKQMFRNGFVVCRIRY